MRTRNNGVFRCHAAGTFAWAHCGVSEMTSSSSLGSTRIILQLILTAISTAQRAMCKRRSTPAKFAAQRDAKPSDLSQSEPVDAPIMILTLTSDTYSQGELSILPRRSWLRRFRKSTVSVMRCWRQLATCGARRAEPAGAVNQGVSLDDVRTAISNANVRNRKGRWKMALTAGRSRLTMNENCR